MPGSKGLTEAWRSAAAACPVQWDIKGVVQGPREADPVIRSPEWVAWAKGPHGEERAEGRGDSPEQALSDLANRLRTLA